MLSMSTVLVNVNMALVGINREATSSRYMAHHGGRGEIHIKSTSHLQKSELKRKRNEINDCTYNKWNICMKIHLDASYSCKAMGHIEHSIHFFALFKMKKQFIRLLNGDPYERTRLVCPS